MIKHLHCDSGVSVIARVGCWMHHKATAALGKEFRIKHIRAQCSANSPALLLTVKNYKEILHFLPEIRVIFQEESFKKQFSA